MTDVGDHIVDVTEMVCPTNASGFFMHNVNRWVEIRSPFVNLWVDKTTLLKCFFVFIWSVLMRRVFYLYLYIPKGIYKYK
jgi:hypothetical protein